MNRSLSDQDIDSVFKDLTKANLDFAGHFPGERSDRQPVHTVYGGAHLFKSSLAPRLGELSLKALGTNAGNFVEFAQALGLSGSKKLPRSAAAVKKLAKAAKKNPDKLRKKNKAAWLAYTVYSRVVEKLKNEPVEDFRIDFEDGFGNRPDEEEDAVAVQAADEVAKGMREGTLPPFIGIRIKPFNEELKHRSARTLDIFLSHLLDLTGGKLPDNFVITLPKIPIPQQITALIELLEKIELQNNLAEGTLKIELMIELTQTLIDASGQVNIPLLVKAGGKRIRGAHFGTYDYTASCNITAAYQTMMHPACTFARHMMMVTMANTGIMLSDGATNVMPIGPHKPDKKGKLKKAAAKINRKTVHRAWRLHYDHIAYSLELGFYQGWDLHPAQLPIRYAAMYNFFLEGFYPAAERLSNFINKAAQATLVGDVFDDAATGQGLLNYFLRAMSCGAITEDEAKESGLTIEEIRSRSFVKILDSRSGKA